MVFVERFYYYFIIVQLGCGMTYSFLPCLFPAGTAKMPQVMVVARNFMDMVAALPAAKLDMLYDSAFICEAVLRSPIHRLCSAFPRVLLLPSRFFTLPLLQVVPAAGKEVCASDAVRVGAGACCSYRGVGAG
jgi:hypothetical protein